MAVRDSEFPGLRGRCRTSSSALPSWLTCRKEGTSGQEPLIKGEQKQAGSVRERQEGSAQGVLKRPDIVNLTKFITTMECTSHGVYSLENRPSRVEGERGCRTTGQLCVKAPLPSPSIVDCTGQGVCSVLGPFSDVHDSALSHGRCVLSISNDSLTTPADRTSYQKESHMCRHPKSLNFLFLSSRCVAPSF